MVIMIVSILKASHVSWPAFEIAHSRLRHDVVRKPMLPCTRIMGDVATGDRALRSR